MLTFALVLKHLEELLDALVPGVQRLLLGVDPHLQLLKSHFSHCLTLSLTALLTNPQSHGGGVCPKNVQSLI